jgi:hypothetical protein
MQKAPTVISYTARQSIVPIQHFEHESNQLNTQEFSVSELWKSQEVDVVGDGDSVLSSVNANVDSSDDESGIYDEEDASNVFVSHLQANEMTHAPK